MQACTDTCQNKYICIYTHTSVCVYILKKIEKERERMMAIPGMVGSGFRLIAASSQQLYPKFKITFERWEGIKFARYYCYLLMCKYPFAVCSQWQALLPAWSHGCTSVPSAREQPPVEPVAVTFLHVCSHESRTGVPFVGCRSICDREVAVGCGVHRQQPWDTGGGQQGHRGPAFFSVCARTSSWPFSCGISAINECVAISRKTEGETSGSIPTWHPTVLEISTTVWLREKTVCCISLLSRRCDERESLKYVPAKYQLGYWSKKAHLWNVLYTEVFVAIPLAGPERGAEAAGAAPGAPALLGARPPTSSQEQLC